MSQSKLVRLLGQLASLMKGMSDAEVDEFLADLEKLARTRRQHKGQAIAHGSRLDERFDPDAILTQLRNASTRTDGQKILDREAKSRRHLTQIARTADVYVTKADPVGLIQEKIVEAVIGSRLNSLAIRGG